MLTYLPVDVTSWKIDGYSVLRSILPLPTLMKKKGSWHASDAAMRCYSFISEISCLPTCSKNGGTDTVEVLLRT